MLSKTRYRQERLDRFGQEGRCFERFIQPVPSACAYPHADRKNALGKEISLQKKDQVGERPFVSGFELQVLEQEHGDQCCPNLDLEGILARTDKRFHLQVLLQGLEEYLYLPAVLVDGGDSGGAEMQYVGQENDLFPFVLVQHHDPPHAVGAILSGIKTSEFDDLIGKDIPIFRNPPGLNSIVCRILLLAGHEPDALFCPAPI